MLEIVYAENSEQFLWENSEQFYLMQKIDFMNVVSKFKYTVNMMCRVQILLKWVNNFLNNAKQKIILCRMLEIVYAENNEQFLWENSKQFYIM